MLRAIYIQEPRLPTFVRCWQAAKRRRRTTTRRSHKDHLSRGQKKLTKQVFIYTGDGSSVWRSARLKGLTWCNLVVSFSGVPTMCIQTFFSVLVKQFSRRLPQQFHLCPSSICHCGPNDNLYMSLNVFGPSNEVVEQAKQRCTVLG